jgi:hypothetical protein
MEQVEITSNFMATKKKVNEADGDTNTNAVRSYL